MPFLTVDSLELFMFANVGPLAKHVQTKRMHSVSSLHKKETVCQRWNLLDATRDDPISDPNSTVQKRNDS